MMLFLCCKAGLLTWMLLLSSEVQGDCPTSDLPPHSGLRGGGPLQVAYPVGTTLQFRCIPGYKHIPGITPFITCLNNSTWSAVPTFCQGRRCPIPNLPNGRITSSNDLRLGEEVTFACDYGFRLIGQAMIRCVLRAGAVDWNRDVPFCQRIPCVRPAIIPNGHYNPDPMDSYKAGSAVTYWCDPDLSLIGNATITCTVAPDGLNGMWDHPPPECKKITCRRPVIQNGRLKTTFVADFTYGDSVLFKCDPTYTLVGASFITCGADNNWHPPVPNCIKAQGKKCRAPSIQNGKVNSEDIPRLGDNVTFSCNHGFRLIGDATIFCVLSGGTVDWSTEFPDCQRIPCARPDKILNGSYEADPNDEYYYGSVVIYHCDPDFSLIGDPIIECTVAEDNVNGKWNSAPPECKKVKCEQPKVQNGLLTNVEKPSYTYNDAITFRCDPGYSPVGSMHITCGTNNSWIPAIPQCVKGVKCEQLKVQNRYSIKLPQPSYTYNEGVSFQCDPGYSLVGSMHITCGTNNSWVPAIPQCIKKKTLEDWLETLEKKLDLILHKLSESGH